MRTDPMSRHSRWPDKPTFNLTLKIRSRLDQIQLVRSAMAGVLGHLEIAQQDIDSLGLAVTEIMNNSMEHGYNGNEDQKIEVRLSVWNCEVQVEIIDNAPPFPEDERYRLSEDLPFPKTPNEAWSTRGHGLQIVRQIVDSIILLTEDNRNCIQLQKSTRHARDSE